MKLTNKQAEYIQKATHRWNIKVGATGAGKSYIDSAYIIPQRILERKGKSGISVIMGVTKETIERNVLRPMREFYGETIGAINSRNVANILNEDVYCLGAEKANQVSKIQGATFKYLYGDEVAKWSEEVFNFAKSRLRSPVSCFDGTLNPESPNHFLYKFIYESKDLDIYCQHYTIDDNPNYPEREKEELKKEYASTVFYDRYILGLWKKAEGLIYPMFNEDFHVSPDEPRPYQKYWISVDYGTQNATAMTLWGLANGVYYCVSEYFHSGRDTNSQKTTSDYYAELGRLAGNKKIECVIVDPSATYFIAEIRSRGKYIVRSAKNDVLPGISDCCVALQRGAVKINKSCENIIDEFASYSWDNKSAEDKPIKEKDHAMDSFRYVCHTLGWVKEPIKLIGQR
ncbi:MAG: PBSX family phage terminase large subunit [Oscillospiraceae bacterium]|nr:PBSX family phage terminase large subunit [Oscillospiraceae bacterium]